jgi:hypothetical protein
MKKPYEAWQHIDECEIITFGEVNNIKEQIAQGLIPIEAKLLHQVEADTYEEAMAVHYIKMGWLPYKPMGEAKECPNECGAMFYPKGSGECPNCGRIC